MWRRVWVRTVNRRVLMTMYQHLASLTALYVTRALRRTAMYRWRVCTAMHAARAETRGLDLLATPVPEPLPMMILVPVNAPTASVATESGGVSSGSHGSIVDASRVCLDFDMVQDHPPSVPAALQSLAQHRLRLCLDRRMHQLLHVSIRRWRLNVLGLIVADAVSFRVCVRAV